MPSARTRTILALILLGAWGLRAAAGAAIQHRLDTTLHRRFLVPGDADGYWELGKRIAAGQPYSAHDPPRRVMRMPGFPAALSIPLSLFGENMLAVRLWLAAIGAAACGLVYLLGTRLRDRRTGLIAAALAALSPMMTGFSVLVLSDTLFAAAVVASLWAGAELVQAARRGARTTELLAKAALVGAAVAAACYVRPSWLLAAPLFALAWGLFGPRRKAAFAGGVVLLGVMLLCLVPWGLRNRAVSGHFVLTTLWAGPSLYDGLNPQASGASDMRFFDRDNLLSRMSEYEMDQHYRRAAREYALDHPHRTARLAAIKLWRYFKPWPSADQFTGAGPAIAIGGYYLLLVGLAVVGAWRMRRDYWLLLLTVGPLFYFAAIHTAFVSSLRYRLPAEYALCVLAACGVVALFDRREKHIDAA